MEKAAPDWDHLRTFLAVLEHGSLSGAAVALRLTQPTAGRHIAALETALATPLFVRSRHGLLPTPAALELRGPAEAMQAAAAALVRTASGEAAEPRGTVRMHRPAQGALVARRIGRVGIGLFAHRDYVAAHGMPRRTEDLSSYS
ncbi:MAG: LysR family transcriptional regulator, partial [Alphaproteobacteria bacterium]|nr:LysR family transcriptional regulator [Alphaproteobacteria bacterium]